MEAAVMVGPTRTSWTATEQMVERCKQPASDRQANEPVTASLMDAILQRIMVALCVVDEQLLVKYANDAGLAEISSSRTITICDGKLGYLASEVQDQLRRAVHDALDGRWRLVELGAKTKKISVSVVPLGEPGYALLVFGMRARSPDFAMSLFTRAHAMTVAEGDVLRCLAEGMSPKEIARQRGVALSTIRSQIQGARQRTDTQNIRDLVSAVSRLPPVMPVGLIGARVGRFESHLE